MVNPKLEYIEDLVMSVFSERAQKRFSFTLTENNLIIKRVLVSFRNYSDVLISLSYLNSNVSDSYSVQQFVRLRLMGAPGITHELCSYPAVLSSSFFPS